MSFGLNTLTRYFGFGWSKQLTFNVPGLIQVEVAGGGCINLIWAPNEDAETFNIYIQEGSPVGLFSSANLLGKFPNVTTRTLVRTESDNVTLLQSTKKYYVGVRAENSVDGEDTNENIFSVKPLGGEPVFVNDRHLGKVL